MSYLKKGDQVWWRGGFGQQSKKLATVLNIEVTNGEKYGDEVDEVLWSEVKDRYITVDLDNEHWAYGEQISRYE